MRVEHRSRIEALALQVPDRKPGAVDEPALRLFSGERGVQQLTFNFVKDTFATWTDLGSADRAVAEHIAQLIQLCILDSSANDDERADSSRQLDGDAIRSFIERNLADPLLSLAHIAKRFGVSKRTLHRSFQSLCRGTVERYIWRSRLEQCARELTGSTSITEVAFKYGFSNSAHFSRMFRRPYGVSPRSFIKAQVEAAARAGAGDSARRR